VIADRTVLPANSFWQRFSSLRDRFLPERTCSSRPWRPAMRDASERPSQLAELAETGFPLAARAAPCKDLAFTIVK